MKKFTQIGLLVALCAAFAPRSEAREITFIFTGTVTRLEIAEVRDLENYVVVGDQLVGAYTFESDTVRDPSDPQVGSYPAITAGWFTVGQLAGTGNSGSIAVLNGQTYEGTFYPDDFYSARFPFALIPEIGYAAFYSANLDLDDPTGQMLSSIALPTTPPSLQNAGFRIKLAHDDSVICEITSLILFSPDSTPPTVDAVAASPSALWPANNKLVNVTVAAAITDDNSGVASATLIIDDEYNEFDGEVPLTLNAATGLWTATVQLRAARYGNDRDGRNYTLTVRATDAAGNASNPATMSTTTVLVPHDQGKSK